MPPVQARPAVEIAATTTTSAAARRRLPVTDRFTARQLPAPSGTGTRASRCAMPRTSGIRRSGSNLCRFLSGAPAPSRKSRYISASGDPSEPG